MGRHAASLQFRDNFLRWVAQDLVSDLDARIDCMGAPSGDDSIYAAVLALEAGLARECELDVDAFVKLGGTTLDRVSMEISLDRAVDVYLCVAESLGVVYVAQGAWDLVRSQLEESMVRRFVPSTSETTVESTVAIVTRLVDQYGLAQDLNPRATIGDVF